MSEQSTTVAIFRYDELLGAEGASVLSELARHIGADVLAFTGVIGPEYADVQEIEESLRDFHYSMFGLAWEGLSHHFIDAQRTRQQIALYSREDSATRRVSSSQVKLWALCMQLGDRAMYLVPTRDVHGEVTEDDANNVLHAELSVTWREYENDHYSEKAHDPSREIYVIHTVPTDLQAGRLGVVPGEQPVRQTVTDKANYRYEAAGFHLVRMATTDESLFFAPATVYANRRASIGVLQLPRLDGIQGVPVTTLSI